MDKLKAVHDCGYLFNDLKPNNILVGNQDEKELHKIRLIDFGISKKYLDNNGEHFKQTEENFFRGNFLFASVNAFNFVSLGRRDDLISLCYLLVYMVDGASPFNINLGYPRTPEVRQREFKEIRELKVNMPLKTLCGSPAAKKLLPFMEGIFALEFEDKPDYSKLRFLLVKILLDKDDVPTKIFDWCP